MGRWTAMVIGAAVILASCAVTLAAPASQAASGVSHTAADSWRTAATVAQAKATAEIDNIAAVNAGDAWASGQTITSGGKHAPIIEHWAGRSWQRVHLPAKIAKTWTSDALDGGVIAASSASNVWVVGEIGGTHYARTDRHGWQFGTIPGTAYRKQPLAFTLVTTVRVFDRTDVWVFGLRMNSAGTVTPYAAQFTGHRWAARRVPGSGAIVAVAAQSPRDILALAGTDAFTGLGTSTPSVVRWNGSRWQPLGVRPTNLPVVSNASAMAMSGGHIWIGGDYPLSGKQLGEYGDFVAELTGSKWELKELPDSASATDFQLNSLVPDGRGGLWALGDGYVAGVSQRLWHYTGGRWRVPISPRFGGSSAQLLQLAPIPGTGSVWGAGVRVVGTSDVQGLIAIDGPTPR